MGGGEGAGHTLAPWPSDLNGAPLCTTVGDGEWAVPGQPSSKTLLEGRPVPPLGRLLSSAVDTLGRGLSWAVLCTTGHRTMPCLYRRAPAVLQPCP